MSETRRLPILLLLVGVLVLATLAAAQPAEAAPNLECRNRDATGTPWFDDAFNKVPGASLSDHVLDQGVPQGFDAWNDYYGAGNPLLIYTAYKYGGGRGYLQGIDPRDGSKTHYARIRGGHVGGVADWNNWVYVTHETSNGRTSIRRYSKSTLAKIFRGERGAKIDGQDMGTVAASSFIAIRGDVLFAGKHEINDLGKMRRYRIRSDGKLGYIGGSTITIPQKTQGVAVLKNHFIFSTSYGRTNRSNLYVVRRGYQAYSAATKRNNLWCVRAPVMSEGIVVSEGKVRVIFESGARKFGPGGDNDGRPSQRLKFVYQTPVSNFTRTLN